MHPKFTFAIDATTGLVALEPKWVTRESLIALNRLTNLLYITRSMLTVRAWGDSLDIPEFIHVRIPDPDKNGTITVHQARVLTVNVLDSYYRQLLAQEEAVNRGYGSGDSINPIDPIEFAKLRLRWNAVLREVDDAQAAGAVLVVDYPI